MFDDLQKAALTKKEQKSYPSSEKTYKYTKEIRKDWEKYEKDILKEISKISKLKWKENLIKCYIKGKGRNFSNPINIGAYKDKNIFIDVLTHELIHEIELQNKEIREKWRKYLIKNYPKEEPETLSHLLLFSVHYKIYMNLFNQERLKINLERNKDMPPYKRAWEIVFNKTPEKIIKEFAKIK